LKQFYGLSCWLVIWAHVFYVTPESDIDAAMSELTARMTGLLNQVQSDYPDSPIGERWAPARLGGTAPTPQEIQARKSQRKEL